VVGLRDGGSGLSYEVEYSLAQCDSNQDAARKMGISVIGGLHIVWVH